MSETVVFWVVCAAGGYLAWRFRTFRRETEEQFEWVWQRVMRLEQRLREIEKEATR